MQTIADAAAHEFYDAGAGRDFTHTEEVEGVDSEGEPIFIEEEVVSTWDYLTNDDKLEILSDAILQWLRDRAQDNMYKTRQATADSFRAEDKASIL